MNFVAALLAALISLGGSQIVIVPPAPDGSGTEVDLTWAKGSATFGRQGYAFYIDGMHDVIYRLSDEDFERDFAPVLDTQRAVLAQGLPELPHSYAALLPPPKGEAGHLEIQVGAASPVRIDQAGQAFVIDGYPAAPNRIDEQSLRRDFGDALATQAATLKAMASYLALLDHPDGSRDTLTYRRADQAYDLTRPGQALGLDGSAHEIDPADVERDFADALAAEREILAAGLPELAHSRAVLLGHEDGPLGSLSFEPAVGAMKELAHAGEGVAIDGFPDTPKVVEQARIERDFGPALEALAAARKSMRSYLLAMPDSEGPAPQFVYRKDGQVLHLDQPGDGLTLVDGVEFTPDASRFERDFAAALDNERAILAAGLPELLHSRVVLLAHDMGPLGELQFTPNGDGKAQPLAVTGQEIFIDGYPDAPHAADKTRFSRDFAPTLISLDQALKTLRSYLVLLDSPDGAASKVIYRTAHAAKLLEHPGESTTLDGFELQPDLGLEAKDFGAARASTKQILDEGLPKLPHSYVALVKHPAGQLGEVEILAGLAGGVVLDQSNQAVIIDGYSNKTYRLDDEQYRSDFGDALNAVPPLPMSQYLYFDSGSNRLAKESREAVPVLLEAIRQHPAADISIAGYTDTVGGVALNETLSLQRAEAVAGLIRKSGVPYQEINVSAFGKSQLAVETPDNTPELLNRRVEIIVR